MASLVLRATRCRAKTSRLRVRSLRRTEAGAVGAGELRLYGPPETPPKSRVSPASGVPYAAGAGASGSFASCFLKWAFAAVAASAGTIQVVFLTSSGRGYVLRRYARRFLGSMPISSARALGVSGALDMVPLSVSVDAVCINVDPSSHTRRDIARGRVTYLQTLYNYLLALLNHCLAPCLHDAGIPPAPPVKDHRIQVSPMVRAKRAKPE